MRRATFNTSELGDYRVDGGMLISLVERLVQLMPDDVADLHLRTRLRTRTGDGHIETLGEGTTDLVNGIVPNPDSIDLDLHGRITSEDPHGTFLFSLRLDPRNGDQVYANGPERISEEAFRIIREAVESTVRKPDPEAPERGLARLRRRLCTSFTYYVLLGTAMTCILAGFAISIRGYGDAVLFSGYGLMLLAFIVLASIPRKTYLSWEQQLDRRQKARTIDLSLPEAAPLGIDHLRLLPSPQSGT